MKFGEAILDEILFGATHFAAWRALGGAWKDRACTLYDPRQPRSTSWRRQSARYPKLRPGENAPPPYECEAAHVQVLSDGRWLGCPLNDSRAAQRYPY